MYEPAFRCSLSSSTQIAFSTASVGLKVSVVCEDPSPSLLDVTVDNAVKQALA